MKDVVKRYYASFLQWLAFHHPIQAFMWQAGQIGLDEGKGLVREWVESITAGRQDNPKEK